MATINGNSGNNNLLGTSARDTLNGLGGNDTLNGGAGIDTLIGGIGDDTYIVDTTTDIIRENPNGGIDTVRSSVSYTLGDYLNNLTLTGSRAINGTGNSLDNTIIGNNAANILDDGDGNNDGGDDTLYGRGGNDTLYGSQGDHLFGEAGNDFLTGGDYPSRGTEIYMNGGTGNDSLLGDFADMYGGDGNDYLASSFSGNQYGGNGNDTLFGDDISTLDGGAGNDLLYVSYSYANGGDGDDVLTVTDFSTVARMSGGNGNDTLNGGGLNEGYNFNFYAFDHPREGVDTITNFFVGSENQEGQDQIVISANGFGGNLTAGSVITPDQFVRGTAAVDVSDRFIYNNGALFFDPTGSNNGATDQVQFATLVGAPGITNSNIFVDT